MKYEIVRFSVQLCVHCLFGLFKFVKSCYNDFDNSLLRFLKIIMTSQKRLIYIVLALQAILFMTVFLYKSSTHPDLNSSNPKPTPTSCLSLNQANLSTSVKTISSFQNRAFNIESVRHLLHCNSKTKVAICSIIRDQHPDDLIEWVWYHKWIGIEHFFITEHLSHTVYQILNPFIDLGFMAFMDADEYIILQERNDYTCIGDFFEQFKDYGALGVNWKLFGSSGHIERPKGGTLSNYVQCNQNETDMFSRHVKLIANLKYVYKMMNSHVAYYSDGKYAVNEHFKRISIHISDYASWDYIALHHYQVKSKEDYEQRLKRKHPTPNQVHDNFDLVQRQARDFCWRGVELSSSCCFDLFYR
eukprot:TRINITY_DN5722_c1_g1_i4.p1 TRINITY_DN5722_c1_g1~~TRINITY_DN5722_c1_g1_i4.p1  ORF type:complete len:358 (-),score=9.16 TRINITY_DN5722_c1_g1_i4:1485-2558(-)